jgi:hypothetical protein
MVEPVTFLKRELGRKRIIGFERLPPFRVEEAIAHACPPPRSTSSVWWLLGR